MKNKKIALYSAFAVAFGLAVITTSSASANNHDHTHSHGEKHMEMEYKASMDDNMHTEMKNAVEADDYSLLSSEAMEKISEEEFEDMVERHEDMMKHREELEEVIADQNYDGYIELMEEHREEKHDDMDDDETDDDKKRMHREDLSDEEKEEMMKEKYDMLVSYYEENGTLPEKKLKTKGKVDEEFKKMHEKRQAEFEAMTEEEKLARQSGIIESKDKAKKTRKYFKESHRGIVKNVIKSVKHDRLEKAIARIDATLEVTTDESIVDMLEGIKEVIMEVMEG